MPSSVSWWPPTPRPGPPQVADLTTRRCPRQPKAATTRHCLVPVLCRSAKTSFPEARTTPLRSVVLFPPKPKRTKPLPCPPGNPVPRLGSRPSGSAKVEPVWGPPGGLAGLPLLHGPASAAHRDRPAPRQQEQRVSAPLFKKGKRPKGSVQARCSRCRVLRPRSRVASPSHPAGQGWRWFPHWRAPVPAPPA